MYHYHNHPNRNLFHSIPKVELHRHLEGSLRLSTMLEISKHHNLDLPYHNEKKFKSLVQIGEGEHSSSQNFLSKFSTLRHFYQSPDIIKQITRETIVDAAADNIKYFELRFTPIALARLKDFPLGEVIDWVIENAKSASKETGIQTRLIVSINRHESIEFAEKVMRLAVDRKDKGIVGIDLAGSEADFPGTQFIGVFNEAHQAGLKITIHGGEWAGAGNIELALNKLHADRIGHGVRIFEDEKLVQFAKERNIHFEVCPTSNFQSGIFNKIEDHPLGKMWAKGLNFSINTDDPSISQIDLTDEFLLAHDIFDFDIQQIMELNLNAARSAFLPKQEKEILISNLNEHYNKILAS